MLNPDPSRNGLKPRNIVLYVNYILVSTQQYLSCVRDKDSRMGFMKGFAVSGKSGTGETRMHGYKYKHISTINSVFIKIPLGR